MRNRLLSGALAVLLLMAAPLPAHALETQPGDACTTADQHQQTGGPENPGTGYHLVCDGSVWKAITTWDTATGKSLFQVNNDAGSCTATKLGRIRYDGTSTWEYCNGTSWANIASGGARLDQIAAATAPQAGIANGANTIVWNWATLATATTALTLANTNGASSTATTLAVNSATTGAGYGIQATISGAGNTGYGGYFANTGGGAVINYGVYGESNSTGIAVGVGGKAIGAANAGYGVYGVNTGASNTGFAFYGINNPATNTAANWGGYFQTTSTGMAIGVEGVESGAANNGVAVYGAETGASNTGSAGYFANTGGGAVANFGVYGATNATGAALGVYGQETGASNTGYGVYGSNASATGYGVYSAGALGVAPPAQSIVGAASANYATTTFTAPTTTVTAGVAVTNLMSSYRFNPPTISTAVPVTSAATMTIAGAPVRAGASTLASTYGLKINSNAVSTATSSYGLYVDAPTGAANNYAAVFPTGNVGIGTTSPGLKLDSMSAFADPASSGTSQNGSLRLSNSGGAVVMDMGIGTAGWIQTGKSNDLSLTDYALALNPRGGFVGVGTNAPNVTLDVQGTTNYVLTAKGTAGSNRVGLGTRAGITNGTPAIQGLTSGMGATDLALQAEGGNVGIGTMAPTHQIDAMSTVTDAWWFETTGTDAALDINAVTANYQATVAFRDQGTMKWLMGKQNYQNGFFLWDSARTRNVLTVDGGTGDLSLAPTAGNVGIGTTAPATTLDVRSLTTTLSAAIATTTATSISVAANNFPSTGSLLIDTEQMTYTGGGTTTFTVVRGANSTTAATHLISTTVVSGIYSTLLATTGGNVGIGTPTPAQTLDVNGQARIYGELEISGGTSASWPSLLFGTIYDGNGGGGYRTTYTSYPAAIELQQDNGRMSFMMGSGSVAANAAHSLSEKVTILESGNVGIGSAAPLDPFSIGTAINASATHALFNLSNTALVGFSANGTYIGANPAAFTGDFFNFQVAGGASVAKLTNAGALTVTSCTGCGGGARLDQIAAATAANTINNVAYAQTWNWNSLTTGNGLTLGSSSLTTGKILYLHNANAAATGSALYVDNDSTDTTYTTVGISVYMNGAANTGNAILAYQQGTGNQGIGVFGINTSTDTSGQAAGIFGKATGASNFALGVGGWNSGAANTGYGVWGRNDSATGYGVYSTGALKVTPAGMTIASAANANFATATFTAPTTTLTGSTAITGLMSSYQFNQPTITGASGAITGAAAMTISGAPIKGTVTLANTYGLKINSGTSVSTATNAYGLYVDAPTGATNNYAATFMGGSVGIGTAAPAYLLDIVNTGSSITTGWGIELKNTTASGYSGMRIAGTGERWAIGVGNASEASYSVANDFFIYDIDADKIRVAIDTSGRIGIGSAAPVDPFSIGTAINTSATHALFNLSNTALVGGSGSGTYIGANPATFTGNFFDFQLANVSKAKLTSAGALTVTSCTGCGGGGATGSDTQVAFNNAGTESGDANLTYTVGTTTLAVPVVSASTKVSMGLTAGALAPTSLALADLSGNSISSPASGDVLTYNGTAWVNTAGFSAPTTGTFTPTYAGTTTAGSCTYTTQVGSYAMIGKLVTFSVNLVWSSCGTAPAGAPFLIKGLPFTSKNTANLYQVTSQVLMTGTYAGFTAGDVVVGRVPPNTTQIEIKKTPSSVTPTLSDVAADTAATIMVSGSYIAN